MAASQPRGRTPSVSDEIKRDLDSRMHRALEALERELAAIRTGRASTSLVERIQVEYYGTQTPLNQLASISVPEAHSILIQPWDRSALGAIEKAILKSDVGLTPNNDGTSVRLNIPLLTEERRRDLVKVVHKHMEETRVELRNHRREAADDLKRAEKEGELGTDEVRRELEQLQKVTDRWTDDVDRVGKHKEQEILEVG
jgi:ribosome recycling factor